MSLEFIWFVIVGLMLTGYIVLDGFDLGAGVMHVLIAKTDGERKAILKSVGPVWDGNEVWLIAGGASLFLAFPRLFAMSFSGFYLPLMIVLWLLTFRALGIEMRHHMHHPVWDRLWDAAFFVASALLTLFFGIALGNVLRGTSFDHCGHFFAPLWTDFGIDGAVGIIDWYTLIVGATATALLSMHGALWIAFRCADPLRARAWKMARHLFIVVVVLLGASTIATFFVQPQMAANLGRYPIGWIFPAMVLGALAYLGRRLLGAHPVGGMAYRAPFLAGGATIAGLMASAAYAVFPYVLPARDPSLGLTFSDAAAEPYGLRMALYWFIPGMMLTLAYFWFSYRRLPREIPSE